jgi:hypothetical protein
VLGSSETVSRTTRSISCVEWQACMNLMQMNDLMGTMMTDVDQVLDPRT